MALKTLPAGAKLKLDLMFDGVRYSDALGEAAGHSFPNFYPYRFQPGEHDPTGKGKATIPYLMITDTGTHLRIRGSGVSPWVVNGSRQSGYTLTNDRDAGRSIPIDFEPLPAWMQATTSDGVPMAQCGVSVHGDMAVINLAPGCEYFIADKQDGKSMRCGFCAYGAPNERSEQLGQVMQQVSLPEITFKRMQETLARVIEEAPIRHIYLVGGSMMDPRQEGERYIEIARKVQEVVQRRIPVSCGSGAIPYECMEQLHAGNLVDNICFNLEVWSEPLFSTICPGKNRFVGYQEWINLLEQAVSLWGRGRVYSAMVAGIELEPEHKLSWQDAADIALQGAEEFCSKGIIPIYSLYWPVAGREHPDYFTHLRAYFEKLNLGYLEIREKYDLRIWEGFMCHRCAYMQLECDIDREVRVEEAK
jgi:hypothetical protein